MDFAKARGAPFAPPETAGLSPQEAQAVRAEVSDASLYGFHYAVALGSLLVLAAGLLGAIGLRNPTCKGRRAEGCPGGQITGVPEVVARNVPERVAA